MISHVSVCSVHFLNSGSDSLVGYLARVLSMTKKSKKAVEAAEAYHYGKCLYTS